VNVFAASADKKRIHLQLQQMVNLFALANSECLLRKSVIKAFKSIA